jgi:predicted nucleic acid-binding protein
MSDVVVVDASLAIKWVLSEPDSSTAIMLLKTWTNEGKKAIAPALFAYEVTNIIYRRVVAGLLTYDEAMLALTDLFSIGVSLNFLEYKGISTEAVKLAHRFGLSASYDSHYLALAQRENCEFWTADTRLWNSIKNQLSWVQWFGNYQP